MTALKFESISDLSSSVTNSEVEQESKKQSELAFNPVVLNLLQSPACLIDETGSICYLNDAWHRYAGLQNKNVKDVTWTQLVQSDDHRNVSLGLYNALTERAFAEIQCRLVACECLNRWFILNTHPIKNGELLCICTDIQELKTRVDELENRASVLTDMLDISVDCVKLISPEGDLVHMNKAGCLALGVPEVSAFGMPWLPLLPSDVWAQGEQALATARSGVFSRFPGRSVVPGHEVQHWDNMLTPVTDDTGAVTGILCVSREVTSEYKALKSIQQSQERLAIAARVGGLGIWDYDIQRDELHCDETWYRIMGRDPGDPVRSIEDFRPLIHPEDVDRATEIRQTAAELIETGRYYGIEFRIIRSNGDVRWVRSAAYLQHEAEVAIRAVGFLVDITDARRGEEALRRVNRALEDEKISLRRQSLEDPLTGIANRRYLDRQLSRICNSAPGDGSQVCVGIIDIDYFKAFNDHYGHQAGDRALRGVASALKYSARDNDFVARYGGDEFFFVLNRTNDPVSAIARLRDAVSDLSIEHKGSPFGHLTVSCGYAVFRKVDDESPGRLLDECDRALYEAKANGRNQFVIRIIGGIEGGESENGDVVG
jgi:diguanylate cyclase (GGDEF)-like protein/PAS domain S-box-containing protein